MEKVIIGVTFFLGVALGFVAIVALFTRRGEGRGTLKLPGIELSGTGAPILFLLVAAVLVLSGFGWASSQREVVTKERERVDAVRVKTEVVREARSLDASLRKQVELNQELTAQVSLADLRTLQQTKPELMGARAYEPSPKLRAEINRLPSRK